MAPDTEKPNNSASGEAAPSAVKTEAKHQDRAETAPIARGWPELIKGWSDALFALMKSILLLFGGALLVGAVISVVAHNFNQRSIMVDLDPNAEKLLLDLGSDVDLRSMLVDQVNLNIKGVKDIAESQSYDHVNAIDSPVPVSIQPFGLDVSTNDVTRWIRDVFGNPPVFAVRIGVVCSPGPCNATATASAGVSAPKTLMLLVDLTGPNKNQRLSFPVPAADPGLRRGLREAVDKTAEKILEQAAPLAASDFYLNQVNQSAFSDEYTRYLDLAAGATFPLRNGTSTPNCLADNVLALSLIFRGDTQTGAEMLRQAGQGASVTTTCRILSQTNLAIALQRQVGCATDAVTGEKFLASAAEAINELGDIPRTSMTLQEYDRIATLQLELALYQIYYASINESARAAVFCGYDRATSGSLSATATYDKIPPIIADTEMRLPPSPDSTYFHDISDELVAFNDLLTPSWDVFTRYRLSNETLSLVDHYINMDPSPRRLFLDKGRSLMDMALALHDAQRLPSEAQLRFLKEFLPTIALPDSNGSLASQSFLTFQEAQVAFENAGVSSTVSPLSEPAWDMEPLVLEGDAAYANGDVEGAIRAYSDAIDKFIDEDEPADDIVWLAKATARWATLIVHDGRIHDGACKSGPVIDAGWDAVWTRLGAAKNFDLCGLTRADPPPVDGPIKWGLIRTIYPLVWDSIRQCGLPHSNPDDTFTVLDCLKRTGPESAKTLQSYLSETSSTLVDEQIQQNQ